MVNIKAPLNPVQKRGLWPPKGAREYTVLDSDDWWKIAAREHIDVWALIEFNFQTRVPEEVNWYLRELVGCRHTKDGRNYAFFGADQKRRKIYLPVVAPPVPPQVRKYPTYGLYFRRYAPFDTFGVPSFEGDKRAAASTSLKVTSRTYGCVMFNQFEIVHHFAGSSGTHYHSSIWGDIVGMSKVSKTVVRTRLAGPGLIEFEASTAGGNPLIPKSPDIDTFVTARFDFGMVSPRLMRISGEVFGDDFPNLEVFLLCYRSAHTVLLIDGRTTGGRRTGPITRLARSHRGQSLGRLSGSLLLNENLELTRDYTTAPTTI